MMDEEMDYRNLVGLCNEEGCDADAQGECQSCRQRFCFHHLLWTWNNEIKRTGEALKCDACIEEERSHRNEPKEKRQRDTYAEDYREERKWSPTKDRGYQTKL